MSTMSTTGKNKRVTHIPNLQPCGNQNMNINNAFPTRFVKSSQLTAPRLVTISGLEIQDVAQNGQPPEKKPVLIFAPDKHATSPLVLNATNAGILTELFGPETDLWTDMEIELYCTMTDFSGKQVPCVRIRSTQNSPWLQKLARMSQATRNAGHDIANAPDVDAADHALRSAQGNRSIDVDELLALDEVYAQEWETEKTPQQ